MIRQGVALQRIHEEAAPAMELGGAEVDGDRHKGLYVQTPCGLSVEGGHGGSELGGVGCGAFGFSAASGLEASGFLALGIVALIIEVLRLLASSLVALLRGEDSHALAEIIVGR